MYIVPQKKAKADPRLRTSKSRVCLSVCAANLFHRLDHLLQLGIIQSYVCRHFAFSLKYHQGLLIEIINDVLIRMIHYVFGITIQRQHVSFGDSGNVNKTKLNDTDAINRITKSHFLFMRPPLLGF